MWESWLTSMPDMDRLGDAGSDSAAAVREPADIDRLAQTFLSYDERKLQSILRAASQGNIFKAESIAYEASSAGTLLPDIDLMAAAFRLSACKFEQAADLLHEIYDIDKPVGVSIRRMYPQLRFSLRVSPCVMLPLYPGEYCASMMYALALWRSDRAPHAIEVLREMVQRWGMHDEIRLVAGQIYIEQKEYEAAIAALQAQEATARDSVELARCLYLSFAHFRLGETRTACRILTSGIRLCDDDNPFLLVRARLLLAELFERNGLLMDALREGMRIDPDYVPSEIAAIMMQREERWLYELEHMNNAELERMLGADAYQAYLPEPEDRKKKQQQSKLDRSRDPLRKLEPKSKSWLKRREEEERLLEIKSALARGEEIDFEPEVPLSHQGYEMKRQIAKAQDWWPERRAQLASVPSGDNLARRNTDEVQHVRFEYGGTRPQPEHKLAGEIRAQLAMAGAGAAVLIFIVLLVLRSCIGPA